MFTQKEFVTKIKTKYPQYSGIDDNELYNKVITKYPQYKSQISQDTTQTIVKEKTYLPEQNYGNLTQGGATLQQQTHTTQDIPKQSTVRQKTYFPDEVKIQDTMRSQGYGDDIIRGTIVNRRRDYLKNRELTHEESKILINMANKGIEMPQAVDLLKKYRIEEAKKQYEALPTWKKAVKNFSDFYIDVLAGGVGELGGITSFVTGGKSEVAKQAMEAREAEREKRPGLGATITRELVGAGLIDTLIGGAIAKIPIGAGKKIADVVGLAKIAPTKLGRFGQAIKTGVAGGVLTGIGEKGAEITPREAGTYGAIGGITGGVLQPVTEKIFPKLLPKDIQKMSAKERIEKGREFLYEAVNPTKQETKAVLQERVDDLLPYIDTKNPFNNTLKQVKERIDVDNTKALNSMIAYENNVGVKGTLETKPIIDKLTNKFQEKIGESFINSKQAKIAEDLKNTLAGFGDVVKDKDIIKVRRAWDEIEKTGKGFMRTAEDTDTAKIFGEANKFFREEIRKSNPEYAKYLTDYHRTITIGDVIQATIDRRVGQQDSGALRRGLEIGARMTGIIGGGPQGYVVSEALIQGAKLLSSSSIKLFKGAKILGKGKKALEELGEEFTTKGTKYGIPTMRNNITPNNSIGGMTPIKQKKLLPQQSVIKKPAIITPQTIEGGIIMESKKGLEKTKLGTTIPKKEKKILKNKQNKL